jgi:D-alanine-D-alanine ligase
MNKMQKRRVKGSNSAVRVDDESAAAGRDSQPDLLRRRSGRLDQLESQVQRLLERMNIAVIYGGDKTVEGAVINKTRNSRSWKSYQSVAQDIADSLQRLGAKNVHLMPEDMKLGGLLRKKEIHFAWLNTGGVQGYDSMAHGAALLEMVGIPYVGHDPLTAGVLDDKHAFKRQLNALGIATAAHISWHLEQGPFSPETNLRFRRVFDGNSGPFIVKPVCGRASQRVSIIDDVNDLKDAVAQIYDATENDVLIEEFLPGREFAVAVCGQITVHGRKYAQSNRPFTFSAVERVVTAEERIFTSMDVRPITLDRLHLLGPKYDPETLKKLEKIARNIFAELDLETLIRLDLRMDANGEINILEANPKPDLKRPTGKKTSIVCTGLQAAGMDYDDLILSLFADRIDRLFCQRRNMVTNLTSLLD